MAEPTASPSVPLYPGFCPKVREPRWMSSSPQSPRNATAADFIRALSASAQVARSGGQTIGEFLDQLGEGNAWLMALILTLPFIQPLPTGPIATFGGLAFAGIGWRLIRGDESVWLPMRIRSTRPRAMTWNAFSGFGCGLLGIVGRVSRTERMVWLVDAVGRRGAGWLILVGGLLVALPFLVVPLQNSLPALVIFFACIGRLQRDGVMYLLALLSLVVTLIYFTLVTWVIFFAAEQSWMWLRAFLRG
ncbi:MAG: exopolysaccharide biosynthesis protein [Pedosphaera sp.]|nr:exopolysaccharide biosynthesis protein [Pedosphaera sp.]